MTYLHELEDWPRFHWQAEALADDVSRVRLAQSHLQGRMEQLGLGLQREALLRTLTADVMKTSEIEGVNLEPQSVRSSLAQRLGIPDAALGKDERKVAGVVEMTLDATQNPSTPLTVERLFTWHAGLFATGWGGGHRIRVGAWRLDEEGPMRVVSGAMGRERTHYVAPAAERVPAEMDTFLEWFNRPVKPEDAVKPALAHLWFVTIHPFDDGNGRIARAIADMCLARVEGRSERYYSMSSQIRVERKGYYEILERIQKRSMDVTKWMHWFLGCQLRAIEGAAELLQSVLHKARVWQALAQLPINERQQRVINRLLDGFEGKLTAEKWGKLAKCSERTALRDIQDLIAKGILVKGPAGGRSTHYLLADF